MLRSRDRLPKQLMVHDALGAHARDELGISETLRAGPIQAALASAASFAVGASMPLFVTAAASGTVLIRLVAGTSLIFPALLAGLAARAGGAGVAIDVIRVTFWGALAVALTAGIAVMCLPQPPGRVPRSSCNRFCNGKSQKLSIGWLPSYPRILL